MLVDHSAQMMFTRRILVWGVNLLFCWYSLVISLPLGCLSSISASVHMLGCCIEEKGVFEKELHLSLIYEKVHRWQTHVCTRELNIVKSILEELYVENKGAKSTYMINFKLSKTPFNYNDHAFFKQDFFLFTV